MSIHQINAYMVFCSRYPHIPIVLNQIGGDYIVVVICDSLFTLDWHEDICEYTPLYKHDFEALIAKQNKINLNQSNIELAS